MWKEGKSLQENANRFLNSYFEKVENPKDCRHTILLKCYFFPSVRFADWLFLNLTVLPIGIFFNIADWPLFLFRVFVGIICQKMTSTGTSMQEGKNVSF
jgi:hypothetical protein